MNQRSKLYLGLAVASAVLVISAVSVVLLNRSKAGVIGNQYGYGYGCQSYQGTGYYNRFSCTNVVDAFTSDLRVNNHAITKVGYSVGDTIDIYVTLLDGYGKNVINQNVEFYVARLQTVTSDTAVVPDSQKAALVRTPTAIVPTHATEVSSYGFVPRTPGVYFVQARAVAVKTGKKSGFITRPNYNSNDYMLIKVTQ